MTDKKPRSAGGAWYQHLLLAPPLLFFAAFAVFPLLFTLYVSLSVWSISGDHRFIGFGNYAELLTSPDFQTTFFNTVAFAVATVLVEYVCGMTAALMLYRSKAAQGALRLAFLLPMMFTPVVVGFIWRTMFDPSYGPVDALLRWVGFPSVPWLSERPWAFAAVVIADVWQWTPFMFLIIYAAMRALPTAPLEAAVVDGASSRQVFWDHMMPMLLPASLTAILLRTIESFKLFDVVYLLTGGGPGVGTATITLSAYFTGLRNGDLGSAAAMTFLLLVVVLVVTTVLLKVAARIGRTKPRRRVVELPQTSSSEGVPA